jgi:hypothetical protein
MDTPTKTGTEPAVDEPPERYPKGDELIEVEVVFGGCWHVLKLPRRVVWPERYPESS